MAAPTVPARSDGTVAPPTAGVPRFQAPDKPIPDVFLRSDDGVYYACSSALLRLQSTYFDELWSDSLGGNGLTWDEYRESKPVLPVLNSSAALDLVLPFVAVQVIGLPSKPQCPIKINGTDVPGFDKVFNGATFAQMLDAFRCADKLEALNALEIIVRQLEHFGRHASQTDALTLAKFGVDIQGTRKQFGGRIFVCARSRALPAGLLENPLTFYASLEGYAHRDTLFGMLHTKALLADRSACRQAGRQEGKEAGIAEGREQAEKECRDRERGKEHQDMLMRSRLGRRLH